jgi:hypothetical protein
LKKKVFDKSFPCIFILIDFTGWIKARNITEKPMFLEQVKQKELSYVAWNRRFILLLGKRYSASMEHAEVEAFFADLAVWGKVAASTQNQAFCAILFLFKNVLNLNVLINLDAVRAKRPLCLPTVYPVTGKGASAGLFRPMLLY